MNKVIEWLKQNAEKADEGYFMKGGYADGTFFEIVGDDLVSVFWSDQYGHESTRHLTIEEFEKEFIDDIQEATP